MTVDWAAHVKNIPHRVHVSRGTYAEVVYVDDFPDGKTWGETRWEPLQIAIKRGLSDKLTVITYLHEIKHLFSFVYGLDLTEKQILAMEPAFYYFLKPGNIFKKGRKKRAKKKKAKK